SFCRGHHIFCCLRKLSKLCRGFCPCCFQLCIKISNLAFHTIQCSLKFRLLSAHIRRHLLHVCLAGFQLCFTLFDLFFYFHVFLQLLSVIAIYILDIFRLIHQIRKAFCTDQCLKERRVPCFINIFDTLFHRFILIFFF